MILLSNQQSNPHINFDILQLMVFVIICILGAILLVSVISLKMEISRQEEYLNNLSQSDLDIDKYIKIPYNKSGLYSIIIASLFGIIAFLFFYHSFIITSQKVKNTSLEIVTILMLVFLIALIIIMLGSFYVLVKRIHTPLYYEMKGCPRCGSSEIHKVEYSWWGGIIGPLLVHQMRCKKCGKTYNGVTGTNITKQTSRYFVIIILILSILVISKYFF
jgi:hypothetical protein